MQRATLIRKEKYHKIYWLLVILISIFYMFLVDGKVVLTIQKY